MKEIEVEFQSNANGMGVMIFKREREGTNPTGKRVYIYSRRYPTSDKPLVWEVFIPSLKKAGKYKLPTPPGEEQKWITYEEDFEEYPGASRFGHNASCCSTMSHAAYYFDQFMGVTADVPEDDEAEPEPLMVGAAAIATSLAPNTAPGIHRGRPKAARPALTVPAMEFSVKDLAAKNDVDYPIAAVFVREALEKKEIHFTREERRAAKGPMTKLFAPGAA